MYYVVLYFFSKGTKLGTISKFWDFFFFFNLLRLLEGLNFDQISTCKTMVSYVTNAILKVKSCSLNQSWKVSNLPKSVNF